jgi:hypothetical protein
MKAEQKEQWTVDDVPEQHGIKAQIAAEVLQKYIRSVKTGLPGMAHVQLDLQPEWPAH